MSVDYNFPEELRHFRNRLGMTQEQAAEALSISVRYLQYIEAGKRNPGKLLKLRIISLLAKREKDLQKEE